ncbi:uncharacterized protein LOC117113950 [Anneissia japonica]|uniref:uncharacterized protein LOC117113950 n=1 Tax=Anneissia japonica TaxID=1529436 RepID=UPI0014255731|nr:uncharacterized protein LOC117113950 [Anneissia japonica]
MGGGCTKASTLPVEENVTRWRGHVLYDNGLESDEEGGPLVRKSSSRRRLSAEIKAMYTSNAKRQEITILHFNDVYNITQRHVEPVGGAARFATMIRRYMDLHPLVFFSGDALNPSIMSSLLRGTQMIPILNAMHVKAAVYGNHDFDFGIDELQDFVKETDFPWLLSNVIDDFTGCPLADGVVSEILHWRGTKIGIMGLVEEEWLVTLATIDRENLTYIDFVTKGKELAKELKEQGAEFIIALTHMRMPNDIRLAEEVDSIDLILGGHDHDYEVKLVNNKYIVKSGTEFRHMTKINISFYELPDVRVTTDAITIDSSVEEDPEVKSIVGSFQRQMTQELETSLGHIEVELDGRFSSIRNQETNLGNFVADIMLEAMNADIALINSGTFRSDTLHPEGEFKKKDLKSILPLVDSIVVLKVTGMQIWKALENSVCQYPKKEGRFPQVAGMRFSFNPEEELGQRVDPLSIIIEDEGCILPNKVYRLCTKNYIAKGKDGYTVFKDCEYVVDEENGPNLFTIVQNHFASVMIVKGLKPCRSGHRQSLISLAKKPSFLTEASLKRVEHDKCTIAPEVEGRITQMDEEQVKMLPENRETFLKVANGELDESILIVKHKDDVCEDSSESEESEVEEVQEIIEPGTPPGSPLQFQREKVMQEIWTAVERDDVIKVKQLLDNDYIDVDSLYENIMILHKAASCNAVLTTYYLVKELGAYSNCRDDLQKSTPLMHAVESAHIEVSAILLEFGANVDALNELGKSALDLATEDGKDQIKIMMLNGISESEDMIKAIEKELNNTMEGMPDKDSSKGSKNERNKEEKELNENIQEDFHQEENDIQNDKNEEDLSDLRTSPTLESDQQDVTLEDDEPEVQPISKLTDTWRDSRRGSILEVIHEEDEDQKEKSDKEISQEDETGDTGVSEETEGKEEIKIEKEVSDELEEGKLEENVNNRIGEQMLIDEGIEVDNDGNT